MRDARRNLIAGLAIATAIGVTLTSVLRQTHMDEQYGMAKIKLAHETVFVKSRKCAAGCNAGLWLSRSSDRCKAPNAVTDYSLHLGQILYAQNGDTLVLVDDPHSVTRPTGGDWINMQFAQPYGSSTAALSLHEVLFGEHLPTRAVPTQKVEPGPCVRAFGHDWNFF